MDEFLLECGPNSGVYCLIPVQNVLPERTLMADISVTVFAKQVVSAVATRAATVARESLRKKGY